MLTLEKAESIQDSLIVSLWVFVAGLIWSIIVVVISLFLWNNTDIFAGFRNSGSISNSFIVCNPCLNNYYMSFDLFYTLNDKLWKIQKK